MFPASDTIDKCFEFPFPPHPGIECSSLISELLPVIMVIRFGYQSKKQQEKKYSSGFLRYLFLASLTSGYLWYSSFPAYAANDNSEKENTIRGLVAVIRVELQALLISGLPSRVRNGRSCKVEILICGRTRAKIRYPRS